MPGMWWKGHREGRCRTVLLLGLLCGIPHQ